MAENQQTFSRNQIQVKKKKPKNTGLVYSIPNIIGIIWNKLSLCPGQLLGWPKRPSIYSREGTKTTQNSRLAMFVVDSTPISSST